MSVAECEISGAACCVWRSGYTGEDGYEISCAADAADGLARTLLAHADVGPIGLGARDSLRLEAGLCLYGHDIDTTTTPIEAGLLWSIGKSRREKGGFPGADIVQKQIADGHPRRRVGLRTAGRATIREHTEIFDFDGAEIGVVTSGGFGPVWIAGRDGMSRHDVQTGTQVEAEVRGKRLEAKSANYRSSNELLSWLNRESPMSGRYTADHEWIRIDGEVGTVGIEFRTGETGISSLSSCWKRVRMSTKGIRWRLSSPCGGLRDLHACYICRANGGPYARYRQCGCRERRMVL